MGMSVAKISKLLPGITRQIDEITRGVILDMPKRAYVGTYMLTSVND